METELVKEQTIFEEQKAKAREYLKEIQNKSAVKIQASFRAYHIYKMYAPVIRQRKEETKRKKEMQEKMNQERKELEEKVKLKLEEKKRKEDEKRFREEIERNKMEVAKRLEHMEQERRQREYEKRKKEEKQRLEKEKLLRLEAKKKSEFTANIVTTNNEDLGEVKPEHSSVCLEKNAKGVEDSWIEGQKETMDEVSKDKMPVKQCEVQQQVNIDGCAISIETQTKLEPEIKPKEIINDYLYNTENSSLMPNVESKEKQDKGVYDMPSLIPRTPQTSLLKETDVLCNETAHDSQSGEESGNEIQNQLPTLSTISRPLVLSDQIEEKRLAWMKSCKPWSTIMRENRYNNVTKKTKQRKISAANKNPPLNKALILKHGPWNDLQQVRLFTLNCF